MLKTIDEANNYVVDRIEKISWKPLPEEEKMAIELCLKDKFYEKLSQYISDEEIENLWAQDEKDLENKLFYKIPNYVTLVESSASQYLAEYFVWDYIDASDLEWVDEDVKI